MGHPKVTGHAVMGMRGKSIPKTIKRTPFVKRKVKPGPTMKAMSKKGKWANENYRLVRARVLEICPRCVVCGGPGAEVDHIHGRHGFTGKLQRMVAPRNMQTMCNSQLVTGKQCHTKKTGFKDGHQDFRSNVIVLKLNLYQGAIEANLPVGTHEMPAWRPELREAIKAANETHRL